jgi:DNA-binding MarR family transcriptional regulator
MASRSRPEPTDEDYQRLLAFRTRLRQFLQWSEAEAQAAGVTAAQHQLLLAVRGTTAPGGPTISEVSEALLLKHHSAVGLIDRAEQAGLIQRQADKADGRVVRLRITRKGAGVLHRLSTSHLDQLRQLAPALRALDDLDGA